MKKYLLTTTAAGAVMAMTAPAQAEWYMSVFAGTNYLDDQPGIATQVGTSVNYPFAGCCSIYSIYTFASFYFTDVEVDDGYVVGAALGMGLDDYVPGLSVELELAKRNNDAKIGSGSYTFYYSAYYYNNFTPCSVSLTSFCAFYGPIVTATGGTFSVNEGKIVGLSLMANVWYEFDVDFAVRPYIGGGVGVAMVEYDSRSGLRELEKNSFAYQLMAGIAIDLTDTLALGLEYRYFDAPDIDFTAPGQTNGINFDYNVQNVILRLKKTF